MIINNDTEDKYLKTLNRDMELIKKSNGKFDLNFNAGDNIVNKGTSSLYNGIIIRCLTGYQELNRTKNPIYQDYGNKAYELLKANKSNLIYYRVEQYFRRQLNTMRRIKTINELTVKETLYGYSIYFNVTSINDEIAKGIIDLRNKYKKLISTITLENTTPYADPENPLIINAHLTDELGNPIAGQILHVYVNDEFIGITKETDANGYVEYHYQPRFLDSNALIQLKFNGNLEYNTSETEKLEFESLNWMLKIDENDNLHLISVPNTMVPNIKLNEDGDLSITSYNDEIDDYYMKLNGDVMYIDST